MKRFTITMYDVCQDFETQSWIAKDDADADGIRAALERLKMSFKEEELTPGIELFDCLVCNSHRGSRSSKGFRTADEVRTTIDNLLGIGHSFPAAQGVKLEAFLEGTSESFSFEDREAEVSIIRRHPSLIVTA